MKYQNDYMKSSHCTKYERNIREISALEEFILYRPLIKLQNVPLTYSLWSYQNTALKYYYQIMRQIRRRKYFQKHHLLTQRCGLFHEYVNETQRILLNLSY